MRNKYKHRTRSKAVGDIKVLKLINRLTNRKIDLKQYAPDNPQTEGQNLFIPL